MRESSQQNRYAKVETETSRENSQQNPYAEVENVVYDDNIECVKIARLAVRQLCIEDALFN